MMTILKVRERLMYDLIGLRRPLVRSLKRATRLSPQFPLTLALSPKWGRGRFLRSLALEGEGRGEEIGAATGIPSFIGICRRAGVFLPRKVAMRNGRPEQLGQRAKSVGSLGSVGKCDAWALVVGHTQV